MCGIAGYLGSPEHAGQRLLRVMCDQLAHRGPDAFGSYFDGEAALGHRRLSIIDVSGGQQPLGNEDGSVQVVFNGEIYNFQELRKQLIHKGHQFQTRSDTEVLVHLYEDAGDRMPEYLNGMFAFAIWDSRRQELFLARDRMGKKPLYYTFAVPGLRFCFASELKSIVALPQFDGEVNARAVADFLTLSYVPDPATIFEDVYKLAPGHCMLITRNDMRLRRYWAPPFSRDEAPEFRQAVEELESLAGDAVRRRMISDVPLGGFLSGGLDSSAIVGLMSSQHDAAVKTFSIGFNNRAFDELEYARIAARRNETEHYEEVVTPDVQDMLDVLSLHFDEPFGDSSALPSLYLARMARRHVTVALSGDGADEIFGGYRRYRYGLLEQRLRTQLPAWFRHSFIRAGGRYYPKCDYLPQVFRAKTLLTNLAQDLGNAYFNSITAMDDRLLASLLHPDLKRELGEYTPRQQFVSKFRRFRHLEPVAQMQAVDFETYLPGDILVKADRSTMAYSLEGRSPWLDYRIVELACRLPDAFKVQGRSGKHVMKRAMEPHVPKAILTRKKMGFSVPLAQWFRTTLVPVFQEAVLTPEMSRYIDVTEARRLLQEHRSGMRNHDRKLWNLLMLARWNAKYCVDRQRTLSTVSAF